MNKKIFLIPLLLITIVGCDNKKEKLVKQEQPTDFRLEYKENFKILHLTDIQIIDSSQARPEDDLGLSTETYKKTNIPKHAFYYMDKLVETVKPDLITLGGDNVYGRFDDNLSCMNALAIKLSKYNIPYTLVYGNHDNESKLGKNAQNEIWKAARNCLFKDKFNTIGLYGKDNSLKRTIVMFDSNGCSSASEQSVLDGVNTLSTISPDQFELVYDFSDKVKSYTAEVVKSIFIQHILPKDVRKLMERKYIFKDPFEPYIANEADSFGSAYENSIPGLSNYFDIYDTLNVDSAMYGHDHINNLSIELEGRRYTWMMKSSTYDYHRDDMLGGTITTIFNNGNDLNIEHIYIPKNPNL